MLIVNGFFTYAGVEVNAVHVDDLRNPAREFPKAILVAVILILLVFILADARDLDRRALGSISASPPA